MDAKTSSELALLESERRMAEAALRGQREEMARKLNGAMGRDMMMAFERKERKPTFWRRLVNNFDKFLLMIR